MSERRSSRPTGQAKLVTDADPEGCSPCLQNQSQCKTTDRITGRATVRGYVQSVERRLQQLENHCHNLEARLASVGVHVEPPSQYDEVSDTLRPQFEEPPGQPSLPEWRNRTHSTSNGDRASSTTFDSSRRLSQADTSVSRLPDFRNGLTGDNYLGVSSGNSLVSSIRGTSLNVLGMEIDLTDYTHDDLDEPDPADYEKKPVYNKSYYAFILTAFSAKPKPEDMGLPPREEGMKCAEWFFRLNRVYDDPSFQPTPAERVIVHCIFAIMLWQFVVRNWENPVQQADFNRRSNLHYHYALGFFRQLMASHTLQDVQAMAMLCIHLRALPKPGACWMMTSTTLNLAIELGLHRSMRSWDPASRKISVLEIELRKRIFWSVLVVHIIISGKLGRPMALREEDYDVELPRAISDDQLSEDGIDLSKPGRCEFMVGMTSFRFEPICIDLYNNIYAVKRSPQSYIDTVLRLEDRIQGYIDSWDPDQMREWDTANDVRKVYAMYVRMWPLEFRLLLRHPSLSLTSSNEFNDESLSICMDLSKQILATIKQLQAWKSLDSNWQTGALFVLAISTTLFGHWERRDEITLDGFEVLKEDMKAWLSILCDLGRLLGSGRRLEQAVRVPIDNTLGLLSRHLTSKTASSALASTDHKLPPPNVTEHIHPPQLLNESFHDAHPLLKSAQFPSQTQNGHRRPSYAGENDAAALGLHPPQTFPQYPYPDAASQQAPRYLSNPTSIAYALSSEQPQTTGQQPDPSYLYPEAPPQAPQYPPSQHHSQQQNQKLLPVNNGIQAQWRNWAGSMAINLEPQEYLNSANALMQLGTHGDLGSGAVAASNGADAVALDVAGMNGTAPGLSWPNGYFGPDVRVEP
ncbi:MAG: hypothetical protein LQ350_000045 [Teloschistes chrysophthalmus]|nr:MAG: hypothetical protein LQ350_000045 [Niorma chrysophthalma]